MTVTPKSTEFAITETKAYLEYEAPIWVEYKNRVERTAGLDAQLNAKYQEVYARVDRLLEELFAHTVILGVENGSRT